MGVEDPVFLPSAEGAVLTETQANVFRAVFSIDKVDITLVDRGSRIPLDGFPDVVVRVGNDGMKLMVASEKLGIFAKVYWEDAHAVFVAEAYRGIGAVVNIDNCELQIVSGVMGRAVVFAYRDDIVKDPSIQGMFGMWSEKYAVRDEIRRQLEAAGKYGLAAVIGETNVSLAGNKAFLSDFVLDSYYELTGFCDERNRYLN